MDHKPIVIAHRGNSSEAPENTLAAFKSAAENLVPFIEFDIHLTKDGIPVILHDRHLSRTSNNAVSIEQITLAEAKLLDCGKWFHESFAGEKILTLKELLEAPLSNIGLMVEIKDGSAPDPHLVAAVLQDLKDHQDKNHERPIVVGSLSPTIMKIIKEKAENTQMIAIAENEASLKQHLENQPEFIAVHKSLINKDLVHKLHLSGKKVWVWTVDTSEDIQHCLECLVDGIISNHPKYVKKFFT